MIPVAAKMAKRFLGTTRAEQDANIVDGIYIASAASHQMFVITPGDDAGTLRVGVLRTLGEAIFDRNSPGLELEFGYIGADGSTLPQDLDHIILDGSLSIQDSAPILTATAGLKTGFSPAALIGPGTARPASRARLSTLRALPAAPADAATVGAFSDRCLSYLRTAAP